ncbi:MAG TPA: T9SS type A sorting domain-containing protein, partial [Chitinophagales bacterium]|nr:T9SS type A sorting domain-containing protein [Chitinophagales bacterium]
VYPNPTSSLLNIDIQSKVNCKTTLKVYDVVGKIVFEENIELTKGINKIQQDYTSLASGTYIMTFTDIDGVAHKFKFVKTNK